MTISCWGKSSHKPPLMEMLRFEISEWETRTASGFVADQNGLNESIHVEACCVILTWMTGTRMKAVAVRCNINGAILWHRFVCIELQQSLHNGPLLKVILGLWSNWDVRYTHLEACAITNGVYLLPSNAIYMPHLYFCPRSQQIFQY